MIESTTPQPPALPKILTMVFSEFVDSSAVKCHPSLGRDKEERDRKYLETIQSRHFALVRECIANYQGSEVSTMGDTFFITFDDAERALRCTVEIQNRLKQHPIPTPLGPLRLRIGMHSGRPKFFEGSWHGTDVDTAARTETAGNPGQILVSTATHDLLRDLTDIRFHRLGTFALKGLGQTALWEVDWEGAGPHRTMLQPLAVLTWRKRAKRGLTVAAALVLAAALGVLWKFRTSTGSVAARRSVAVLGFQNLSAKPDVAWLSTALAEMFNTELAAGGKLRTVPGEEVARFKSDLKLTDTASYTQAALDRIRQNLGADDVISGAFLDRGSGGEVRLELRAQDTKSKEVLFELSETGTEANLSDMVSRAAAELRQRLGVGTVTEAEAKAMKAAMPSLDATRLYAEGLQKLRASDAPGARDVLQQAISADPKYPLAHSALAVAWSKLGNTEKANEEAKAAYDLSTNLSREERLRIEGVYRESTQDWKQAAAVYRALFSLHPDNLESGLKLASALNASGDASAALAVVTSLRKLPGAANDRRIAIEEKRANDSLPAAAAEASKSTLELTGGIPGARVEVDGHVVGQFDGSGTLRTEIAPGDHTIELKKDNYTSVRFTSKVVAGATVRPDKEQLKMTEVAKAPPPPDPKQLEAQDWERVRNAASADELDEFVRLHPGGAHLEEARSRSARLRQQMQAEAARQAEAAEWTRVQSTADIAALEDFRKRYPAGPNAEQAGRRIERLQWDAVDRTTPAALLAYLHNYPNSPYAAQAQTALDQLQQAARAVADKTEVLQPLKAYEAAFAQKDFNKLRGIWPSMPNEIADALRNTFKAVKSLSVELRPEGDAAVTGDTATVTCDRTLHQQVGSKQFSNADRVRVALSRGAGGWVIQSISPVH